MRQKNLFLEDRIRQLEEQLGLSEQNTFKMEAMQKALQRDLRHQIQLSEQIQNELNQVQQKRDLVEK